MLASRKRSSHKGDNGVVLVIGGSEDYIGAPALVGLSALAVLRSGADLVYVAAPEKVAWAVNCISPDIITRKIKCKNFSVKNVKEVLKLAKDADVVEIGNGISLESKEFMQQIIKRVNKPLVIDAGALRVIRLQDVKNAVLLPHAKEFEVLLKNSRLTEKSVQEHLGSNVLVIKGHPKTVIMSKNKTAVNTSGNAGMTHGGTGDVLAGIITGLMAQGNDPFTSARMAAFVNGAAADMLYKLMGFGYIASDLVTAFPIILKKYQNIGIQ